MGTFELVSKDGKEIVGCNMGWIWEGLPGGENNRCKRAESV